MTAQNKWGTLSIWSLYWIKYYSIDWVIHLASHSINISCSACFSIYLTLSWNLRLPTTLGTAAWLRQGGGRMHGPGKLSSAFLPKSESSACESQNRPLVGAGKVLPSLRPGWSQYRFPGLCGAVTPAQSSGQRRHGDSKSQGEVMQCWGLICNLCTSFSRGSYFNAPGKSFLWLKECKI